MARIGGKYQVGDKWELNRSTAKKYAKIFGVNESLCLAIRILNVVPKNSNRDKEITFEFIDIDQRGVESYKKMLRRF